MAAAMRPVDGHGCLVAFYHYVRDAAATPYPRLKALPVASFVEQLDWLARTRTVVDYPTFEAHLEARRSLEASALLTFDDGFIDHYEAVFPRLRDRGWSGVFFLAGSTLATPPRVLNVHKTHFLVATLGAAGFAQAVRDSLAEEAVEAGNGLARQSSVYRYDRTADLEVKHLLNYELPFEVADRILSALFDRHLGDEAAFARDLYLSPATIAEMAAAGMTFGFHGEHHRVLSRLSKDEQRQELAGGVDRVRRLTGQNAVPFCYPYGHSHTYNADTLAILAETGYASAFNTARRDVDVTRDARFEIPRFDTRDLPPLAAAAS